MSNSLATVHPELIVEWSDRNLPLTPDNVTFGSNKKVWWKGACGHEWVLDGATVMYGSASELRATLEYDFSQEKDFSYKGLLMDEIIHHLAVFVSSRLWQIHIFGEGNTRTTAVFFIKYLRTLGFSATNDIFAENAWYFRNALVRANYTNLQKDIHETTEYLEVFLKRRARDMRTSVFGISVKYFLRLSTRCVDNSRTACLGRIRVI